MLRLMPQGFHILRSCAIIYLQLDYAMSGDKGPPKPKDWWDKIDIIGKVMIPVVLGIAGFAFNKYLTDRNLASELEAKKAQVLTTAAQLQNGREIVETELRGNMFGKILDKYSKNEDPEAQVLYLELLVENFSQSLELAPIVREVKRSIVGSKLDQDKKAKLVDRVQVTLENAKAEQLSIISTQGATMTLPLSAIETRRSSKFAISFCEPRSPYPLRIPLEVKVAKSVPEEGRIEIELTNYKRIGDDVIKEISEISVESSDLPLVDNIRIAPRLRLALTQVGPHWKEAGSNFLKVIAFPDSTASFKEVPSIEIFVQDVLRGNILNPAIVIEDDCSKIGKKIIFSPFQETDVKGIQISN